MSAPVVPGQVLAGKYRVERVLGRGGMGVVVAARHLRLGERVALKFLLPGALSRPEAVLRFAREARAAARIKSEHVARVVDVGELEGGVPYMVLEHLEGQDLGAVLDARGALAQRDTVDFVLQACEAVAEAHALGIVHRDLKPSNLFLTRRADGSPLIKVLDFGISKVTADADPAVTEASVPMGSPLYMAPEQMVSARDVDARADVWSLGAVTHQLLAGAPPFSADTLAELCARIIAAPPPSLLGLRPDLAPELAAVVLRALERDRTRRYASVAELAVALAPFGSATAQISAERVSRILGARFTSTEPMPPAIVASAATGITHGVRRQKAAPSDLARWFLMGAAVAAAAAGLTMALMDHVPLRPVADTPTPPLAMAQAAQPRADAIPSASEAAVAEPLPALRPMRRTHAVPPAGDPQAPDIAPPPITPAITLPAIAAPPTATAPVTPPVAPLPRVAPQGETPPPDIF